MNAAIAAAPISSKMSIMFKASNNIGARIAVNELFWN
jgi:hypothetical protein